MNNEEIKEIAQFDATLEKSLEDLMESYKMVDVDQVYSNGTEFVPIFRVKQWLEYNNITNLQEENKEWSMIFDTFSKRPYAHKYLEQKKKELNKPNLIGLDSETIYKDYYELKSRIDKAIEYITSEETINIFTSINAREKWLKINHRLLQGSDKE